MGFTNFIVDLSWNLGTEEMQLREKIRRCRAQYRARVKSLGGPRLWGDTVLSVSVHQHRLLFCHGYCTWLWKNCRWFSFPVLKSNVTVDLECAAWQIHIYDFCSLYLRLLLWSGMFYSHKNSNWKVPPSKRKNHKYLVLSHNRIKPLHTGYPFIFTRESINNFIAYPKIITLNHYVGYFSKQTEK